MKWSTTRFQIDLSTPKVMGIVNITPDSFSDGGRYATTKNALLHCEQLIKDGADILDIGGESSKPGAIALPLSEELGRVLPLIREAVHLGVPVSVDTYKPEVMQAVLDCGADIINDIWALRWTNPNEHSKTLTGLSVLAKHSTCGLCLMHMHGEPLTMQSTPMMGDPVEQVLLFFEKSLHNLECAGINKDRIVIDPGIGFGKTVVQNFELLKRQNEFIANGYPLLAGWSRKSSLAAVTGISLGSVATLNTHDRLVPSVIAAVLAIQRGASIVRVHDVLETVQAIKVLHALN
jgi:dihydropteroate synthase